jgi:outer membrane protein assembly factor BamB
VQRIGEVSSDTPEWLICAPAMCPHNDRVLTIEVTPGREYRLNPYFVYSAAAPIDSSPAVVDQMGFAGDGSGTLSADRVTTGGRAWSASPGGTITSSPAVDSAAGLVVVGSLKNTVSAYAKKTGKPAWPVATGGAAWPRMKPCGRISGSCQLMLPSSP